MSTGDGRTRPGGRPRPGARTQAGQQPRPENEARPAGQAPPGGDASPRKPSWLKVRPPAPAAFRATGALLDDLHLHTVCEEARCPNKGECFSEGTATFLILGDRCTRDCRFCSVESSAADGETGPAPLDADEPRRVAEAAARLGLRHVVVTSVTRDDLGDGGAAHFAATVAALRDALPSATVELLVPDFLGDADALRAVLAARPDVVGHNLETVPRLYPLVRPRADYGRSLRLLERAADWARARRAHLRVAEGPETPAWSREGAPATAGGHRALVKSGIMLGLGETRAEVERVLGDCVASGVDVVTVGQYLRPARDRLPVVRYVAPGEFDAVAEQGRALGLEVVAAPFVRSSYRAGEVFATADSRAARGAGRRGRTPPS
ncbi:MAG TPA: lipoyl synthase [Thermoleophilia bacterium]|nr:lipoyl synthase [Thermoleophilia bacterium]